MFPMFPDFFVSFGWLVRLWFLVFSDMVSQSSTGYPETHDIDKTEFELGDPPASFTQGLGLKACAITTQLFHNLVFSFHKIKMVL